MRKPKKLTIIFLIFALLLTSLASAYGFVICDHGSLSTTHHENHHHGEETNKADPLPYYPLSDENDDSCHDFLVQLCACDREDVQRLDVSLDFELLSGLTFVRNLDPGFADYCDSDRSSQKKITTALLVHRTTVLLI